VPTLEIDRLILREMRTEDADDLLAIFGDRRVMAAFEISPFDRAQMERWVQRNLDHQRQHGYGLFSVILKENGLLVGDCGLEQIDIGVELGYDFRSDYWNRGLATEAAGAVRDFAFGDLGLPRLVSLIRAGNGASRRVAEKGRNALRRAD
jgi:RimJ/RimL family protein N-acetyltransferase